MKENKNTVLITGGNSGIGLALARLFRQNDNRIIITGRSPRKLDQVLKENPDWSGYLLDLADVDSIENLGSMIEKNHPETNVLINNAGVQFRHDLLNESPSFSVIKNELDVNLYGSIHLTLYLLPLLLQQGAAAAIVNVTSALGEVPRSCFPFYSASKAGFAAFTTALRKQVESTPVRVLEAIPPLTATPMNADRPGDKMAPEVLAEKIFQGLMRNKSVLRPGKAGLLHGIHRLAPALASKLVEKSS